MFQGDAAEPGRGTTAALMPMASVAADHAQPASALVASLGPGPFAAVFLFVSPLADAGRLARQMQAAYPETPVTGCTTAGELSQDGYAEGQIVAVALPARHFAALTLLIPDLADLPRDDLIGRVIRGRETIGGGHAGWENEFAFLMVDGLSIREDALTSALSAGLGPVPLFGGSAGDGTRFRETFILHRGEVLRNAAVLTLVRTACRARVFSLDHLLPTERRMVVTEADPLNRIVRQINAEPAAVEYARLLGKDPAQLTTFTFAAHPVVVRVGGKHHVRAIREAQPNGDLVFFSAIDEGLVLTLAEPQDMVTHLEARLAALAENGPPAAILACDCILRRMEATEKQKSTAISALLRRHRVVGFSTYGEQLNALHVNQTMTGVAIYPPEEGG
jgi:hypothetical protein